jgi:Tol biopolymer transport system component
MAGERLTKVVETAPRRNKLMHRDRRLIGPCLAAIVCALAAAPIAQQGAEVALRAAIETETIKGDLAAAIDQYRKLSESSDRRVAAQALLRMADAYRKRGDVEAQRIYERVIRDFGDQREFVATARTRLEGMPVRAAAPGQAARQVWTGDDAGGGSLTADGRYMALPLWSTGDLGVRDLVSNTTRKVTDTGGWSASGDYSAQAAISADGRQIAYHWFLGDTSLNELRLVGFGGGEPVRPRALVHLEAGEYMVPSGLTADGRVVVVKTLADRTNQLGVVSTDTGAYKSIKSLEWRYPRGVQHSPDGRYIAYDTPAGDAGSPRDILVLALDGSRETTVVSGPGDDQRPVWTADGSRLLFTSTRGGNPSLWSVAMEAGRATGGPVLVRANTGTIVPLGVSRSGSMFYWVAGSSRRNVYVAPLEGMKVTRTPTLATEQFVDESFGPSWSPDGRSLAFFSFRGRPTLVIRSVTSGHERTVILPQGLEANFFSGPRWFPDSRSVLVIVADPQGSGRAFYRVDIDSGTADRLYHTDRQISSFALSPDGRSIYWSVQSVAGRPDSGELARYDIAEQKMTVLKRDEWFIAVAVSPDGTQLAYLKSIRGNDELRRLKEAPSVVEVIPTAGGPARQVFRDKTWLSGHRYNTLSWAPDGRHLMFVREDGRLWRIPATGGEPQDMGVSMRGRIKAPSIHPDGTRLVFGVADADDNEVWALDNFLPALSVRR